MPANGLQFCDDVSLFILDDAGVVFDERAQEIYQMNTAATFIWCQIEEACPARDLPKRLAETFAFSADEAERHVRDILADWRQRGFFDDRRSTGPDTGTRAQPSSRSQDQPAPTARFMAHERAYRILGQDVHVGFSSPETEDRIRQMLSHLEIPVGELGRQAIELAVTQDEDGYLISEAGGRSYRRATLAEVGPVARNRIFMRSIVEQGYSIAFHAGAVSDGDRALVLTGAAGSGKTTLTAAMVHDGYRYHSDDLILLDPEDLKIQGVPFGFCIKDGGSAAVGEFFPGLNEHYLHERGDRKRVRYVPPPPASFRGDDTQGLEASWVVFPRYGAGTTTELRALDRSEALQRLVKECTFARPLTRSQVEAFVRWLQSVECYELPLSSLETAVGALRQLWQRTPPIASKTS